MKKFLKILLKILFTLLILVLLLVFYIEAKGTFSKDILDSTSVSDNPFIIPAGTDVVAHRMGSDLNPEDTMMGAEWIINQISAGNLNIDVIEVDVSMTSDGELILLHDETLDRTTDAVEFFGKEDIYPYDYTLSDLRQLNFGENFLENGEYPYRGLRGDEIPDNLRACTINELLDYLETYQHFKYIIEIKDAGNVGMEATDKLISILRERDLIDSVIVASFHEDILHYIDEAYPECHRNASAGEAVSFYVSFLLNKELDMSEIHYDVLDITPRCGIITGTEEFGQNYGLLNLHSQGFMNYAHKNGLAVYYWTVNKESTMKKLIKADADGIISDVPDLTSRLLHE